MNPSQGYDAAQAEYYYVNAVRAAEKNGTLDQLPTRTATDPVDRDRALKIQQIVSRRTYAIGDPEMRAIDPIMTCIRCRNSAQLVMITRVVYSQPRANYGICAQCA